MKVNNVLETIGGTPHIRINRLFGDRHHVWIKSERANPAGSIKDRIALAMVEDAEKTGKLKPGGTIIEPTSGNTGIGLAMVAAVKGYPLILVMPESMSLERRRLMLAYGAMQGQAAPRRSEHTLDEILTADDREDLLTWLRAQPLCHVEGRDCLVHAGLLPQWSVAQARALAVEVETGLRGANFRELLAHLWGSEPAAWSEDLQGWARVRCIVNAMTRMRFCSAQGVMEFRSKGETTSAPAGYLPWFAVPGRRSADHRLVTGHWSALGLRQTENHLALDTGCLWGRQLTAVCLEDGRLFQVDCAPGESACD